MGRRPRARALDVWMNGERVGRWSIERGEDVLEYDPVWIASPLARPISLSLPLRPSGAYRGPVVGSFFENLLPDSADLRQQIMVRFRSASPAPFDLLEQIGRDCVGAIQLLPAGSPAPDIRKVTGRALSGAEIARVLARARVPSTAPQEPDEFRISLAGAQEKTALLWWRGRWLVPHGATPSTHIFKLPIDHRDLHQVDLSASVENEWLCAQLLHALDIPCAPCEIRSFAGQKVLVVERFDRTSRGTWILRRPQEDLCQATGTPVVQKYESQGGPGIAAAMKLLEGSATAATDREDFFLTQFVYWLLCAIDGHAKNFSVFIEAGGRFRLTPRYDVLSAYPVLGPRSNQISPHKAKMAMAVLGKNRHYRWKEIRVRHWLETARRCAVPDAREIIEGVVERVPDAVEEVRSALPRTFPGAISEPILKGLAGAARDAAEAVARGRR
ncbi:MAG TPA: type II toxin-antitoxin system HipA family toxin [Myxococcales bacterium]|nr:type II toxin-antitoxin system HipA family toxin [Myxococcales bacterium]